MGIKQSTLADAAPNPHAAHARLHRALEQVWPSVDLVVALGDFVALLLDNASATPSAATVSTLIPLLTGHSPHAHAHTQLPLPLPDPVAAHLAAMLASYALIDLQILHLKQMSPLAAGGGGASTSTSSGSNSISISPKTPTLALRLAINARPLSSISGMTTRSPKTRRQQPRNNSNSARPSSAPSSNTGPSSMSPNLSFLDSPISYTTLISALSHLILAIDVPGLPLHTPDLPSARLPTAALSAAHTRRISAGGANSRSSQPSHASPRSTKSSKSPLILSWLAPHVHYAHIVQLAVATLGPSSLLPPDPIPLVAQSCTVDELAQILAFAINLWAATACSPASAPATIAPGIVDPDNPSSHFLSPVSPTQSLHPHLHTQQHLSSPTSTFSPSPSTRSIHHHPPSHRISGATINSSILSRPPAHVHSAHAHRPGSLFSTFSTTSTNDPTGANPGNASVFTDHGSTLPDLETRTLRGQWDGGGGRAASLMPVRSMTLSFQGTSDEDDEQDDDDDEDNADADALSVASSVEPPDALSSASATPAAGLSPMSPTPPDMISSPLPQHTPPTTTLRPTGASGGGASPVLAPIAPATLSVASTHTRRHRAGSMTSTTAVFHLRMGDLEDSGGGAGHAPHGFSAPANNATGDRAAADRWSIRSHYPAPSVLSAQTSAVGSSMYHYQSPAPPQRTSYGGVQHRSASFGVPSSPTNGAHVHYPPATPVVAAAPAPVVIPPSRLRPLAHRLINLASSTPTAAVDWDAMVRLVLYPIMPYLWTWSLAPYLGMRMLATHPPPHGPVPSAPGILGSHILPTHAPPAPAAAGAGAAPPTAAAATGSSLLLPSLIAHWLVQSALVPPSLAPDSAVPAPTLSPVAGTVVYRATANGWTDAAMHAALGAPPAPPVAVVALVALAVPFAGATDVEPVVVAVDVRGKGGVVVVSPASVVQRVPPAHATGAAGTAVELVHVPGVVSVELEQQRAHVWIGGAGGLNLPVDVGSAGAATGAVCVVLSVLDVELVVFG